MSELTELLERFQRGPQLIALAVAGATGAEFDFVPAPGQWSVRQILCHLADGEVVGADRFRRVTAEDNPTIIAYDQDAWAANLDYGRRELAQALKTLQQVRSDSHALLASLPESAYARKGTHSWFGEMTLLNLLKMYVEHDEKHAGQIRRNRVQYKQLGSSI